MNPAADVCRVMQAMESDEGAHPMDMDILHPYAVVQKANALAQWVEHLHGSHGRHRLSTAFRDWIKGT